MKRLLVLSLIGCFSSILVCNAQRTSNVKRWLNCQYTKYQNTSYGYSFEYPSVMVVKPYPIEDDPGKGVSLEDGDYLLIESWVDEITGNETPDSLWDMLIKLEPDKYLDHKIGKNTLKTLEKGKDQTFEYNFYRFRGLFVYSVLIESKVRIDDVAEKIFNSFSTNGNNEWRLLPVKELQSLKARAQKAMTLYMDRQKALLKSYEEGTFKGDVHAMCRLGDCFINGIVTEKNLGEAVRWYEKAAQKEDAEGIYLLAEQLEIGDNYTVAHDVKEAERLYKEAAKKGYLTAYRKLGNIFTDENKSGEDQQKGLDYYQKAADKGDVLSMLRIAEWYQEKGDSIKAVKGYQRMIDYMLSSADKGEPQSMFNLAQLYMYRDIFSFCDEDYLYQMFPEDFSKAYPWLKKAADKGSASAMNSLGFIKYVGCEGIPYDEKEAVEWWIKATDHNDYSSYLLLKQFVEGRNALDLDSFLNNS